MDPFLHDAIRALGVLKEAVEKVMKTLEDLATKKAIEDAERGRRKDDKTDS